MNSYRKITRRKNKRKNKSKRLRLRLRLNNKFRKRYQIGCSRKSNMKGGGISPMQALLDARDTALNFGGNLLKSYTGETHVLGPNPTTHNTHNTHNILL
jgi:hypothetical protein